MINEFGYTPGGARSVLDWLKKQGLVIDEEKGEWTITNDGINRLVYGRSTDRNQLPSFEQGTMPYVEKPPVMSL